MSCLGASVVSEFTDVLDFFVHRTLYIRQFTVHIIKRPNMVVILLFHDIFLDLFPGGDYMG